MNTEHSMSGSGFHTTPWTAVLLAGREDSSASASALEELCRTYWYPLYAHARRQGHSPPNAQDLTQEFFAVFLEKKYFGLADPERGRFRCFLLKSFKHFLANEYHRAHAAKRGGKCAFVSWDEAVAEAHYCNEAVTESTPDKLFEQAWALTLLQKVMEHLRCEYARARKERLFDALEVFLSGRNADATYKELGEQLQMSESAIKMAVSRLRQRYGELLRREIAQTVDSPSCVEDELRYLLGVLSR
jgi:RNA polymerase sigma factor (sigma-70 family)